MISLFSDSSVDLSDVMSVVDPLTKVEAGLKGTGDKPIPLQSVHIRAKLLDLVAQVNRSSTFEYFALLTLTCWKYSDCWKSRK